MNEQADNRLFVLGALRLERQKLDVTLPRRKAASLLAYLALHPSPHSRNELAALLWGDFTDHDARASLRTSLAALRDVLGEDIVIASSQSVQINPTYPLWVDAQAFESYARQFLAQPPFDLSPSFIDLYHGDLLPDVYDDWVSPVRERLHSLYVDVLLHAVQHMRSRSDYARAISFAQRVLTIEPANERAHQHLIFCQMATGDRSAAIKQYETCRSALQDDLGVEPMPETTALYQWIKGQTEHEAAAEARITNLPIPLSSFVGREKESTEIKRLLLQHRLVTLTGPGGCGKSRLAVQVATDLVDTYHDGVWFADLSSVETPANVTWAIAHAMGVEPFVNQPMEERLTEHMRPRHTLLVIDNCEHLVSACAHVAESILTSCPNVTILASSREVLAVAGERAVSVPSLSLMVATEETGLADLLVFEAPRLFVERAMAASPGLVLADADAVAVSAVCRQLEGMPLAIELAAARVRALSVHQIAANLHQRFALLASGSRSGPPRQHSLRATIDWSYDLLGPEEQSLLRRLSVFAASFTAEAARAVYGEAHSEADVLDLLSRLIDKSLLSVEQYVDQRRYRLLDTIRMYAWERLERAGEKEETMRRHAVVLHDTVMSWHCVGKPGWQQRYAEDLEYLDALQAMDWCRESGDVGTAVSIIGGLWGLWSRRAERDRLYDWIDVIEQHEDSIPIPLRPSAFQLAQSLARLRRDWPRARVLGEKSLVLAKDLGNEHELAVTLGGLGRTATQEGDLLRAAEMLRESVSILSKEGRPQTAWAQENLADALVHLNRLDEARALFEVSLVVARTVNTESMVAFAIHGLGLVDLRQGHPAQAEQHFKKAMSVFMECGGEAGPLDEIAPMAMAAAAQMQLERAATLWGADGAARALARHPHWPYEADEYAASIASVHQQLGDDAFQTAFERGQAMTLKQATTYALAAVPTEPGIPA